MKDFYKLIYSQDFGADTDTPHGWVQWKGTHACIDLHCKCGYLGHVDAEFFYYYKCPKCSTKYAVGQNVKLIELSSEQSMGVESSGVGFTSCELEEDE